MKLTLTEKQPAYNYIYTCENGHEYIYPEKQNGFVTSEKEEERFEWKK